MTEQQGENIFLLITAIVFGVVVFLIMMFIYCSALRAIELYNNKGVSHMSFLLKRKTESCESCSKPTSEYTTEFNIYTKENIRKWVCRSHRPSYDFSYVPSERFENDMGYRKFVSLGGINYVRYCNKNGDLVNVQ